MKWTRYFCALATLAAIVSLHPIAGAQTKETRRILILNEVGTSYPGINIIDRGIQSAVTDSPYRIEFYSESLDTISFPDPAVSRQHWQNLTALYGKARGELLLCLFGSNDAITPIHSTPCQCDS